jgi:hypothetical protein
MKRLILLALSVGCGSDPVDAEGTYSLSVTNRDNGCNLQNWTVGNSATGVAVVINQEGEDVNADIMDAGARLLFDAWLGGHVYAGTIDGDELDLELQGSKSYNTGNCAYTYNSNFLATLDGDVLTGRINYTIAGNGNTDCAALDGCITYQEMNGTRPPQ